MRIIFLTSATKIILSLLLVSSVSIASDKENTNLKDAIVNGKPYLDIRYRFEHVDQDGFTKDANASTLRTKLGYKSGVFYGFNAILEFEDVTVVGNDNYNDTINGKGNYPVVADPNSTEVNQAYITYTGFSDTTIAIGRQAVNLDNQRFIGTVGWRQNDQTYDAAAIINTSIPNTTLLYGYVNNVNRIFSDDHPFGDLKTNTHLINATYDGLPFGKITAYGYLVDLDNKVVASLSAKTFGIRFSGSHEMHEGIKLLYTAEYAHQSDHADSPVDYDAHYYSLESGVSYKGLTAKIGFESLGSDNDNFSFQTPLATLHKFNGWADKFLSTPSGGLNDIYTSVYYQLKPKSSVIDKAKFGIIYHDFSEEEGGSDYGNEWDAVASFSFLEHYNIAIKYAYYDADNFASDTHKAWFVLGAKF